MSNRKKRREVDEYLREKEYNEGKWKDNVMEGHVARDGVLKWKRIGFKSSVMRGL